MHKLNYFQNSIPLSENSADPDQLASDEASEASWLGSSQVFSQIKIIIP